MTTAANPKAIKSFAAFQGSTGSLDTLEPGRGVPKPGFSVPEEPPVAVFKESTGSLDTLEFGELFPNRSLLVLRNRLLQLNL